MEISNSYSGLIKQNTNNSCIYFQDKALSSYIYIKNYQKISLGKQELEKDFLRSVFSQDKIISLSDIYLNVLRKIEPKKYESLNHGEAFDLDEVLTSLSNDVKDDFQKYGIIFLLQDKKTEEEYLKTNPLKEIIDKPYMQDFFNGLRLTYSERVLFVLAIANEEWGWLFPDFKDEKYKAELFCHICNIDKNDVIAYSRKVNGTLIKLGLFSTYWKINSFVYSYFKNENPSFSLRLVSSRRIADIYDYDTVKELNKDSLNIMSKLKGFMVICSDSDYRNGNFLADCYGNGINRFYTLKQEISGVSKAELEFYIYALSLNLEKYTLFIEFPIVKQLIKTNKISNNPIEELFIKKESKTSLLQKVKRQIIFSMERFTEEDRSTFLEHGIDILYTLKLKLPEKKEYQERFMHFCYEENIPLKFLSVVATECETLGIQPEKWWTVIEILKQIEDFTQEEAVELLRNKYSVTGKTDSLRKNPHYCIEALNTSEPISEVTEALKNADEYQKGEYDEESGIKVLLYGISGGGKTAYAEEVSKKMNRALKIVRPSEVLSKWVGETEQNISKIFKEAAKDHSILLVDEADSFLHKRSDSVNHFEDSKVNSFLVEIERYPGILFCSTNLPDILDKAVDRRFNFKIGFKPLTKEGVGLLCQSYFSDFELDENQVSKIYTAGEVTPGDFATLNGKLRFLSPEKRNAEYITEALCKIVRDKKRSYEPNKIGFGV